jgi:DNA-binding beta-propeller fold protein YncE
MDVAGIDTKSNEVAWKIPTTGRPVGLGFSPDGKLGYAGDYGPESASFTPADLINSLVTLAPLPVTGNGAITVFDPKTGKTVGAPIAVGKGPSSIVVMP